MYDALIRLFKSTLDRMSSDEYKIVITAEKKDTLELMNFNAPTIDEVTIVIVCENMETRFYCTRRNTGQFNIRFVLHSS